jgi:hypothetical protein
LDWLIETGERGIYVHIGVIIKDPTFTPTPLKGLFLLESTGLEDYHDVEDQQLKFGVQLSPLQKVLDENKGRVYWRKMVNVERSENFYSRLAQAHSVVHNRPYDIDPVDWIRAAFDTHKTKMRRLDTFFCSALAAYIFTSLELLPKDTDWTCARPVDFSSRCKHKNISNNIERFFEPEVKLNL